MSIKEYIKLQFKEAQMMIVKFYKGITTDQSNRYISDILSFSFEEQELIHDYIQWLFPLREESIFNPSAPKLTKAEIAEFRASEELQLALLRSLKFMLRFYGYQLSEDNMTITKSTDFDVRTKKWLTPFNHNYLRISRILKSLVVLGQKEIAKEFLNHLEELYDENHNLIGNSIIHWRKALE